MTVDFSELQMRLFIAGAISLFLLSIAPSAKAGPQEDAAEAMTACRAIKVDTVRLACMDAAADLLNDTSAAVIEPPVTTDRGIEAETGIPETGTAATVRAADVAAERAEIAAEREAIAAERAALENERAAIETATVEQDRPSLRERLTRSSAEASDVQIVRIVRRGANGLVTFFTDEGVVFNQANSSLALRPPSSLPAEATLSFGVFGSKWIAFSENPGRKYKVSLSVPD